MIHESKDRGVLTIDVFVGFAALVLMTYVILHPERLGHIPSESPVKKEVAPRVEPDSTLREFTEDGGPAKVGSRLHYASLTSDYPEEYYPDEFRLVEDAEEDFESYGMEDPMLKEGFYDHIQTQRYLLSEEKHAASTVRMRKFLNTWGLDISAVPEAVDLAWENRKARKSAELDGEDSEAYQISNQRFQLSNARFAANHGIDNPLFWRDLLNIQPKAPYGELAMGILAQATTH